MKKYEIKIKELQDHFNVKYRTILNWIANEGLPAVKIGRAFFFNEEDVEQWLQEKERKKRA